MSTSVLGGRSEAVPWVLDLTLAAEGETGVGTIPPPPESRLTGVRRRGVLEKGVQKAE